MKECKKIWKIVNCNFVGWLTDYKIYLIGFILVVFLMDNFADMFQFALQERYRVSPYLLPFCFTHPFMKIVLFSCVIFLFADAPFVTQFQLMFLARTGKLKWYIAQMIYMGICSILMTIAFAIIPVLGNIEQIAFIGDWGKVIKTLTRPSGIINPISYDIVNRHSPQSAMLYTFAACILLSFFLGMIIYLCNLLCKNKSVGVLIAAGFVLFNWFVGFMDNKLLLWFSPISWVDISTMAYAREKGIPSIMFALISLAVVNGIMVAVACIVAKKKDVVNE